MPAIPDPGVGVPAPKKKVDPSAGWVSGSGLIVATPSPGLVPVKPAAGEFIVRVMGDAVRLGVNSSRTPDVPPVTAKMCPNPSTAIRFPHPLPVGIGVVTVVLVPVFVVELKLKMLSDCPVPLAQP